MTADPNDLSTSIDTVIDSAIESGELSLFAEHIPDLESLRAVFKALEGHTLYSIQLKSAPPAPYHLGAEGGKLLADALDAHPETRLLLIDGSNLGDDGMEQLAPAIARHPKLRNLYARSCKITVEGMQTFFDLGAADNPNLVALYLPQADQKGVDSVSTPRMEETFIREMSTRRSKNIALVYPDNEDQVNTTLKTKHNGARAMEVVQSLGAEHPLPLQEWSGAQIRNVHERSAAVFRFWENNKLHRLTMPDHEVTVRKIRALEADYDGLIDKLPAFPASGDITALFTPDENGITAGFAPLDNPRLWDGKTLADFASIPLTQENLTARTPKGSSLLDSALYAFPAEELVPHLNNRGTQLHAKQLIDAAGKPTELFERFIHEDKAAVLFTPANWMGASRQELSRVYEALPEEQRSRISLHRLQAEIAPAQQGIGR